MFWDNLCRLCNERGVKMTNFALEMGLSSGAPTRWKKGKKIPNDTTLIKIADYFGVTKEALLYGSAPSPNVIKKQIRSITSGDASETITITTKDMSRLLRIWERDKDEAKTREERLFSALDKSHSEIKDSRESYQKSLDDFSRRWEQTSLEFADVVKNSISKNAARQSSSSGDEYKKGRQTAQRVGHVRAN